MITRFSDHSANERTYLAWIRTAIAIMAFGFLIEKFNLFLGYLGAQTGAPQLQPMVSAEIVGIGALLAGVLVIFGATLRFFTIKRAIDSDVTRLYSGGKSHLLLALLMVSIGLFLLFYMSHRLL